MLRTTLLALLLAVSVGLQSVFAWECATEPVEPCFVAHGRLSSQNGTPLKIWLIGTTRVVRVGQTRGIPDSVRRYLSMTSPDHSYIYGDFEICRYVPDIPGHMGHACVVGAERLVVENLRDRSRVFRLLSTWPVEER